jgi:alcohol dehydrogenase YqhD (iron-dependent ADH family)
VEFSIIEANPHFETLIARCHLRTKNRLHTLVGGGSVIDGVKFISELLIIMVSIEILQKEY